MLPFVATDFKLVGWEREFEFCFRKFRVRLICLLLEWRNNIELCFFFYYLTLAGRKWPVITDPNSVTWAARFKYFRRGTNRYEARIPKANLLVKIGPLFLGVKHYGPYFIRSSIFFRLLIKPLFCLRPVYCSPTWYGIFASQPFYNPNLLKTPLNSLNFNFFCDTLNNFTATTKG